MIRDKFNRQFNHLRISVTDRCNFRCPYCMPKEIYGERYKFLERSELLTFEEILKVSRLCSELGATKIRITGGEPLVRADLEYLISSLSEIDGLEDLALTTNAYLLPSKAVALKEAGLSRITISLDTLDDKIFREMNGRGFGTEKVLEGIAAAEKAGFHPIKINAVVQRGVNDHTIVPLARYFKERGHIMRFIEYMDVGTRNDWRMDQVVPASEIADKIHAEMPLIPTNPNYLGEVATRYRYVDGEGEIGIIGSVTKPFCGDCTRLRLSPEGSIYTCLFSSKGIDLRSSLRNEATDDELISLITSAWNVREDRYSEIRSSLTTPILDKVEMYHIGG